VPRATKAPRARKPRSGNKKPNTSGLRPFQKGERRVGRQKGTKNRLGVRIKEALLEALELSGQDGRGKGGAAGYFVWLSRNEPAVFGSLIGKVIPMQLEVKDKTERYTPQEAVARLQERGLPVPPSLTSLASQVGGAVAVREEEDYEAELSGELDGEDEDADDGEEDVDDAA
jgi:hypothetical protein